MNSKNIKILKERLGKSLTDISDDTVFVHPRDPQGHCYFGKELKENPSLVYWALDDGDFKPAVVTALNTIYLYNVE